MNYDERLLARRYARALLRVCGDQFSADHLAAMERAVHFFKSHQRAMYYLMLPDFPADAKTGIVDMLFEKIKLPPCFYALVRLLAVHKRLGLIGNILASTLALYKEQHNIIDMQIESSVPLDETELNVIQEFLARKSEKTVDYTYRVNPDLIAGIRAQSDTLLWEYSVRKKLREIRLSVIR